MPGSLQRLAALTFVPHVRDTAAMFRHVRSALPFQYPPRQIIPLYIETVDVDCNAAYFHGIRAGDIIIVNRHHYWEEKRRISLVAGYTAQFGNDKRVLWLRPIDDLKASRDSIFFVTPYDFGGSFPEIIKRRGEYDPIKEFGFDPAKRNLPFPRVKNRQLFREIHKARMLARSQPDEGNLSIEEVFHRFTAVLLQGESADLFKRINNLFPLRDMHDIMKAFGRNSSVSSVLDINGRFFRNPNAFFESRYSAKKIKRIMALIARNRERFDVDMVLRKALSWIKMGLHYKIGIHAGTDMPKENAIDNFPAALNSVLQEVVDYIAPLYDESRKHEAAAIYGMRPVYFKEILERYPDAVSAARHITAVALNAVAGFLEWSFFYDFRHTAAKNDASLGSPIINRIVNRIDHPKGKAQLPLDLRFLYNDADIYSVFPFAPPAASGRNVIRFEISTGCEYRKCTYCSLYEWENFSLIEFGRFKRHFSLIEEYLGHYSLVNDFNRIFLSGGNGLIMPTSRLLTILGYLRNIKGQNRRVWRAWRIESYATTRAILRQGNDGLKQLRRKGLNLVYWGVESGSDKVLRLVKKGFTQADILKAGAMLRKADIDASVTIMPGLGGIKYADAHEKETASVIGKILPQFVTLMGVYAPGSPWERQMSGSKDNRPLTMKEMAAHIQRMKRSIVGVIKTIPYIYGEGPSMKIAAHSPDVTPACFNPETFQVYIAAVGDHGPLPATYEIVSSK